MARMGAASRCLALAAIGLFALIHGVVRPWLLPSTPPNADEPPRDDSISPHLLPPSPPPPPSMASLSGLPLPSRSTLPAGSSTGGCARIRSTHQLLYAAHSGFGNQELALRRALLVSYVLNRTLVLPPLLRQSELAFGPPEIRCRNSSWQGYLQRRAEQLYRTRPDGRAYESLAAAYDFTQLTSLGMEVRDFRQLEPEAGDSLGGAPLAPLGCAKEHRYTARGLRAALRQQYSSPTVRLGSAYFLKADLHGLRGSDACFDSIAAAVLRLPPAPSVQAAADAVLLRLPLPFASLHLRLSDEGVVSDAAEQQPASRLLAREIGWLSTRLAKRLPVVARSNLFVASNIPDGVHSALLAPLCATSYTCADQSTLNVSELPEWSAMLLATGLSAASASLFLDLAIGAAAPRGFFSTSKFCGPAGFRKSTFSEALALRWQQSHAPQQSLCAHAMEHALLQGRAAHGDYVY